jgi:hypothetical protein
MLVKLFGEMPSGPGRYSPPRASESRCSSWALSEAEHISTSYVERTNLTIRMQNRRFTRLTNAFSKKVANLEHSVAVTSVHDTFAVFTRRSA